MVEAAKPARGVSKVPAPRPASDAFNPSEASARSGGRKFGHSTQVGCRRQVVWDFRPGPPQRAGLTRNASDGFKGVPGPGPERDG
jgi:hypothetical protein